MCSAEYNVRVQSRAQRTLQNTEAAQGALGRLELAEPKVAQLARGLADTVPRCHSANETQDLSQHNVSHRVRNIANEQNSTRGLRTMSDIQAYGEANPVAQLDDDRHASLGCKGRWHTHRRALHGREALHTCELAQRQAEESYHSWREPGCPHRCHAWMGHSWIA